MEMDFVEIAELSRVDAFKFPHFRGVSAGHGEGPWRPEPTAPEALAQQQPAQPQHHPTHSSKGGV